MDAALTYIPAAQLAREDGLPACCAKHGRQAKYVAELQLVSRNPRWTYLLLLLSPLVFLIVTRAMRKTADAAAWPFCDSCATARRIRIAAGAGVGTLGLALVGIPIATTTSAGTAAQLLLVGLAVGIAGFIMAGTLGSWRAQSAAEVTADGSGVLVRKPHELFARSMPAIADAARR